MIAPYIRRTPVLHANGRDVGLEPFPLTFKLEFTQHGGSFKVDDDDIVRAQEVLWDVYRIIVEPGGAAAFAALLAKRYTPSSDEQVVVVLCGANTQR